MRSLVVGIGHIAYGHTLRAMLGTHPVAVWQVDADGRSWIEVACQDSSGDHLGRHALHVLLLEARIHG